MSTLQIVLVVAGAVSFIGICANAAQKAKKPNSPEKTQTEIDKDAEREAFYDALFDSERLPTVRKPETVYIDNSTHGISASTAVVISVAAAIIFGH